MLSARIRNHNGQMAIFIALIFQVLFVAFAMVINIGLVVHDKINLQNAVDLAAYYGAQRQAELLNVIAHQNYQIRQAYKLMAWRYQVLGSGGYKDHPSKFANFPPESAYTVTPSLCISRNDLFSEIGRDDSICKEATFSIPEIRIPPPIAGFDPINILFAIQAERARKVISNLCQDYGVYNFLFAANAIATFRREQAIRKQIILGIAANMARQFTEMVDLNGDTVQEGMEKTFFNNLTWENRNGATLSTYNSLSGRDPRTWLNELPIKVTMIYTDVRQNPCGSGDNDKKPVYVKPGSPGPFSPELVDAFFQQTIEPAPGNIGQLSIGFEKNPWILVYAGARGVSRPRQIFWPFGGTVQFEAVAFAQPFGGRIGPWYFPTWPRDSQGSDGALNERTDPVGPLLARFDQGEVTDSRMYLPNYSRFPGDRLGLRSMAAQAAIGVLPSIRGIFGNYMGTSDLGFGRPNDTLYFDSNALGTGGELRQYEIAAIAPDLFDITYYSIDPNWGGEGANLVGSGYHDRLKASKTAMGIPDDVPILGDHGSRENSPFSRFSVKNQLMVAQGLGRPSPLQNLQAPWFVRNREHLLVDWIHNDSFGLSDAINVARFGRCEQFDDDLDIRAPGSCVGRGGRTGYSVKLVSLDFLLNGKARFGGAGTEGTIINKPPLNF